MQCQPSLGYLTESDVNSLQAVFNKAFKLGYISSVPDLHSLISRVLRCCVQSHCIVHYAICNASLL